MILKETNDVNNINLRKQYLSLKKKYPLTISNLDNNGFGGPGKYNKTFMIDGEKSEIAERFENCVILTFEKHEDKLNQIEKLFKNINSIIGNSFKHFEAGQIEFKDWDKIENKRYIIQDLEDMTNIKDKEVLNLYYNKLCLLIKDLIELEKLHWTFWELFHNGGYHKLKQKT